LRKRQNRPAACGEAIAVLQEAGKKNAWDLTSVMMSLLRAG
jgi:hypothetical protein